MRLALCSFVRDERDLADWAAHHLAVGFEHILLYDNRSRVPVREVLGAAVREGFVTVVDWSGGTAQRAAFGDALARYGGIAHWIAFFDADEYLVPTRGVGPWMNLLDRADAAGAGALQVEWRMFGSARRLERPAAGELVTEAYTRRAPDEYGPCQHTKAVVRPCFVAAVGPDPHHFRLVPHKRALTERLEAQEGPHVPGGRRSYEIVALHHYFCKSRADYAEKLGKGMADVEGGAREWREFEDLDVHASVEDRSACAWAEATREILARWGAAA